MLPKKWCVKRTKETAKVINEYFNSLDTMYDYTYIPIATNYDYLYSETVDGGSKCTPHSLPTNSKVEEFEEISFETFLNEVVNKKDMNNTVIEVLDEEHGKKVIEYWKSLGVDTRGFKGHYTKKDNSLFRYYGIINGYFDNYYLEVVQKYKAKIITLPETNNNNMSKVTTTRIKLLSILDKDTCIEFNQEIKENLKQNYDKTDNEEFEVLQSSLNKLDKCNSSQLALLTSISIIKEEKIDYDKLKTGSKVMIKHTSSHCNGIQDIDVTKPVTIVFYNTPYIINNYKVFNNGLGGKYVTFYQNGNYALFISNIIDFITKVIEY